jgi:TonB family protein
VTEPALLVERPTGSPGWSEPVGILYPVYDITRREDGKRLLVALVIAAVLLTPTVLVSAYYLIPDPEPLVWLPEQLPVQAVELTIEQAGDEEEPAPAADSAGQIVSVDQPATEEIPDEARFQDRVNRSVEEEMVRRGPPATPVERVAEASVPSEPTQDEEAESIERQRRGERRRSQRSDRERGRDPAPEEREEREAEPIAAVTEVEGEALEQIARSDPVSDPNLGPDQEAAEDGTLELSAFAPTMENAAQFVGVPGANDIDHLDLPEGERTQIDSFQNLYWSYWDRIKNQVRPNWRPSQVYRRRDPTGRVYGVEDRYTVLRVTLNGDGSLRHVFLERSSDLEFLDREAIRAIRASQPFANVPEGLKDESGLLSFRFGFYFEVSSSAYRIRREDW